MDSLSIIAMASIVIAGLTTGFGCLGPALAEGRALLLGRSASLHAANIIRLPKS